MAVTKVENGEMKYLHTTGQQSRVMSLWKEEETKGIKGCYYNCNYCNLQYNIMYTAYANSVLHRLKSYEQELWFLLS